MERAIAHEVAELRVEASGKRGTGEALARGSTHTTLSGDDIGRLAEARVLMKELADAPTTTGARNPDQIRHDLETLLLHLGLVVGEGRGGNRRELAASVDARLKAIERHDPALRGALDAALKVAASDEGQARLRHVEATILLERNIGRANLPGILAIHPNLLNDLARSPKSFRAVRELLDPPAGRKAPGRGYRLAAQATLETFAASRFVVDLLASGADPTLVMSVLKTFQNDPQSRQGLGRRPDEPGAGDSR